MIFGKKTIASLTVVIAAIFWRNYKTSKNLQAPVVEIPNGKLQGMVSLSRDGRPYFEYLGIPYAKPPLDELRFEPPEPADNWEGIRDATDYGPKCSQVDLFLNKIEGEEDCLQLNVHTPQINLNDSSTSLLPVMVWFHGGLFIFGSGNLYRADYFMDEEIVIVTANYRLSSLGFLNTGDGLIRGNMGLKDQTMALKWIQENIQSFGGDPNSVTIFGESAGAASANFHMLSPMSKGLFHKVIAQSGLALNPWTIYKSPKEQAVRYAEKLNCTTANSKSMVSCLKSLRLQEIMDLHTETSDPLRELISVFVPTVEKDIPDGKTFLAVHPKLLIQTGNFTKVPLLTGVDSEEGLINSAVIYRNESMFEFVRENWKTTIPRLLYLQDDTDPTVLQKINDFYFGGTIIPRPELIGDLQNMTNMFTDRFWNMGFHNGVRAQLNHSSQLYLYYYTYAGEFTLTDVLVALKGQTHPLVEILVHLLSAWVKRVFFQEELPRFGVCHGDEIAMQFFVPVGGPIFPNVQPGHRDYEFSKEIIKIWTSFASKDLRNSSNANLEFMGQVWPPQEAGEPLQYMNIGESPGMIPEPFKFRVDFWNSLNLE